MSVLLLRLAGPMQAWGTQSRFNIRETALEPSKSGVLGLVCAALGKPRDESLRPDLPSLSDLGALKLGVRVDRPGTLQADYHTAQDVAIASSTPGRKAKTKDCEPSTRYYLADAEFLAGLEGPDDLLTRIDVALCDPVWPLFLGRKAFPPSVPVRIPDGLRKGDALPDALHTQPWWLRCARDRTPETLRICMEVPSADGEARADVPGDFRHGRRSFSARRVRDRQWPLPKDLVREWPPCTSPS